MTLRVIVRSDYGGLACNVGGSVEVDYQTFDITAPELEAYLAEKLDSYSHRQVIGVAQVRAETGND